MTSCITRPSSSVELKSGSLCGRDTRLVSTQQRNLGYCTLSRAPRNLGCWTGDTFWFFLVLFQLFTSKSPRLKVQEILPVFNISCKRWTSSLPQHQNIKQKLSFEWSNTKDFIQRMKQGYAVKFKEVLARIAHLESLKLVVCNPCLSSIDPQPS